MDAASVKKCLDLVFGSFPGSKPGPETIALWGRELGAMDAPGPLAEQACRRLVFERRDRGTPPALPDVRAAILLQVDATRPRERQEVEASQQEAKEIVNGYTETAKRLIGSSGWSTPIPRGGHWGPRDHMELHRRRKEAGIPTGRQRWGREGSPFSSHKEAAMAEFFEWLKKLAWTDEQKRLDQKIVDEIDADARARNRPLA